MCGSFSECPWHDVSIVISWVMGDTQSVLNLEAKARCRSLSYRHRRSIFRQDSNWWWWLTVNGPTWRYLLIQSLSLGIPCQCQENMIVWLPKKKIVQGERHVWPLPQNDAACASRYAGASVRCSLERGSQVKKMSLSLSKIAPASHLIHFHGGEIEDSRMEMRKLNSHGKITIPCIRLLYDDDHMKPVFPKFVCVCDL